MLISIDSYLLNLNTLIHENQKSTSEPSRVLTWGRYSIQSFQESQELSRSTQGHWFPYQKGQLQKT